MLERGHLLILVEVERQGSLTAAAEKLCLTQSALSHAIKKLQQHIGTPLWEKDGRSLRFTPAGNYLLDLAKRVLPQFDHAETELSNMAKGEKGTLRIGMECHPCYEWLLKIVNPYLKQWPDVDVDVKQQFSFGGMAALKTYDIDILVTPDPVFISDFVFEPVFGFEQVLVVSDEHPLAVKKWIEPQDLAAETVITYPVEIERLDIYQKFLLPANVQPQKHKQIETTNIMLQMVAAERGVATLPRWLVEENALNLPITAVKLGQDGIQKQIYLGLREGEAETNYVSAFVELAKQTKRRFS